VEKSGYVDHDHQRKGIGRALLADLIIRAHTVGNALTRLSGIDGCLPVAVDVTMAAKVKAAQDGERRSLIRSSTGQKSGVALGRARGASNILRGKSDAFGDVRGTVNVQVMAFACENPAESLLLFCLEAQKADTHLTLFDPSNHGKIDADRQGFSGRSQD